MSAATREPAGAGRTTSPTRSKRINPMIVMAFLFIAVLLAGVPVFIALAGSSFIYTHFIAEFPDFVILHRMAGGIDSFPLLAVPVFLPPRHLVYSARLTHPTSYVALARARLHP